MIELTGDVTAFTRDAGPFLARRPETNVLATVLAGIVEGRFSDPPPVLAIVRDDNGVVTAAALRTPPRAMLCSELPGTGTEAGAGTDTDAVAQALIDRWLQRDPGLPGVSGVPGTSRALAAAWARRSGQTTRCDTAMALHAVQAVVDPPRPAPGSLRPARVDETGLIVEWSHAFEAEAGVGEPDPDSTAAAARAAVAAGRAFVWEAPEPSGEPVSFVAHSVAIAPDAGARVGVPRIGPVYTPPAHRRHGYAGSAVAQLSRRLLDGGASRCVLFTDLANPTSNRIYAEIGYRRFADWEEHSFAGA